MKKLLAVALVLCLLAPCASAENMDIDFPFFLSLYNVSRKIYGGNELKKTDFQDSYGDEHAKYTETDTDKLILILDMRQNIKGVVVASSIFSRNFFSLCFNAITCMSAGALAPDDYKTIMHTYFFTLNDSHYFKEFHNGMTFQFVFTDTENRLMIYMDN